MEQDGQKMILPHFTNDYGMDSKKEFLLIQTKDTILEGIIEMPGRFIINVSCIHIELLFKADPESTSKPVLTTIGSSNFGKRSINRDSELVFWVYGEGPKFAKMVDNEIDRIEPYLNDDPPKGPRRKPIKDSIIDMLNIF